MFFIQEQHQINISDQVKLSIEDFKVLEPTLEPLPSGYTHRVYYPNQTHEMSGEGLITLKGELNWESGNRYIARLEQFKTLKSLLDKAEEENNKTLEAELKKRLPYQEQRKSDYPKIEELVIALWEHVIEKRGKKESGVSELQKQREAIKELYKGNNQ